MSRQPRTSRPPCAARLLALSALCGAAGVFEAKASGSSDSCAGATVVVGTGTFPFTLVGATTGSEGQVQGYPPCIEAGPDMPQDVWFKWVAVCDGLVTISTCGLTTVDTKLAFYEVPPTGCAGITGALCCSDNFCGVQAEIGSCEVQCGKEYLIQIAHEPGTPLGSGSFSIQCTVAPCCPGNDVCPNGSVLESDYEPCGADLNGGCTSPTPAFTPLECGDTVCGTFWWQSPTRDTDWYQFTLDEPSMVFWSVYADVAVDAFIVSDCISLGILATGIGNCPSLATTPCLPAGIYYAFVAPSFSAPTVLCTTGGLPNPIADYVATLSCVPCPFDCNTPGNGSCFAVHSTPYCDDPLCCELTCIALPHCCTLAWDQACVNYAIQFGECTHSGEPPCPNGPPPNTYVCHGGCPDAFDPANNPEPGGLPPCSGFDVIAADHCVTHTFVGCWPSCPEGCGTQQCGTIISATLEFRVTFVPAGFANDTGDGLALYDAGLTFLAGWDFALLAGQGLLKPGGVVTLDLGNLPPNGAQPTDILWSLCDGELQMLIGDDVGVDYATLTVIHCPCQMPEEHFVERGGTDDNFTGPEPSQPSEELLAHLENFWEVPPIIATYDVPINGAVFAESFVDLPTCFSDAILLVGLRQPIEPPFQSPGFVALQVPYGCLPDNPFGQWWMPVLDLETLGYIVPPINPTSTSVLTLPLDNLPPDVNGITDVMSELMGGPFHTGGRLNFFIGEQFSVDWAQLHFLVCPCCDSDLTGDGEVDGGDLGALLAGWGGGGPSDLDGDGTTNGADLGLLLGSWGPCG